MPEMYSSQLPLILCFSVSSGNAPSSGPDWAGKACAFKGKKKKKRQKTSIKGNCAASRGFQSLVTTPEGARLGFQNRLGATRPQEARGWARPPPLLRRPFPHQTCGPGAEEAHAPVSRPRQPVLPYVPGVLASPSPWAFSHPNRHLRSVTSSFPRVRPPQGPTRTAYLSVAAFAELCASRRGKGARGGDEPQARGGATVSRQPIKTRGAPRGGRTRLERDERSPPRFRAQARGQCKLLQKAAAAGQ